MSVPTFDEWLAYWFTPDVGDYYWDDDLSACEVTAYLTQLFEHPSVLLERFSPDIIDKGLWSICGVETGYIRDMRSGDVPIAAQQRCVRAVLVLYRDLFARVCTAHDGHLDAGPELPSPVTAFVTCFGTWISSSAICIILATSWSRTSPKRRSCTEVRVVWVVGSF